MQKLLLKNYNLLLMKQLKNQSKRLQKMLNQKFQRRLLKTFRNLQLKKNSILTNLLPISLVVHLR
jgi:hypothetical protein